MRLDAFSDAACVIFCFFTWRIKHATDCLNPVALEEVPFDFAREEPIFLIQNSMQGTEEYWNEESKD